MTLIDIPPFLTRLALLMLPFLPASAQTAVSLQAADPRNIANGWLIPDEGYSDQPYVVITSDGAWLCVMTTGKGKEGEGGQHIVAVISKDRGRTWTAPIDIEPASGPEASWAVPFKTPSGRVYVFYTYNKENIREVPGAGAASRRVDTLGVYAFKYSDDHGRTWSPERHEIPLHVTEADRDNNFGGKILLFWGVSKPIVHKGSVYWGWNRVTRYGGAAGSLSRTQGHVMRSDNLLTERDPRKLRWEILPESDEGLRAPKGPIAEEVTLVSLDDGGLYAVYRTIDGYLCHAYSRDNGRTWTPPAYATFANGRPIKHPRAYAPVWKLGNGKFLLWFHNHGGEAVHGDGWDGGSPYRNRNPVWISGGIERGGRILWSEPEILLYDNNRNVRISYPDLLEDGGRRFVTQTQKSVARVHEIDPELLEGLWAQGKDKQVATQGLALELTGEKTKAGSVFAMPSLASLQAGKGFTIEAWLRLKELPRGQVLFDARDSKGQGVALAFSERSTLTVTLGDGSRASSRESDPGTMPGTLKSNVWQHVAVVVDASARIITFVVDGVLNDGGAIRQFGWGRIDPELGDVKGRSQVVLAPSLRGEVKTLRIYDRALRTSEVVANFQAGL